MTTAPKTAYDFTAETLGGKPADLADWRGQALLIVNTASKCGFTPQYAGLEALQKEYGPRGFCVLGFPCDQFGHQEPGEADEIGAFCETNYGVSFPMFAKVEVNGAGAHPLFKYLAAAKPGLLGSKGIKWNFTKFLVNRQGLPVARHAPTTTPESLKGEIEALL